MNFCVNDSKCIVYIIYNNNNNNNYYYYYYYCYYCYYYYYYYYYYYIYICTPYIYIYILCFLICTPFMIVYDCPSCSHLRVVPLHRSILDVSSGFFKVVRCHRRMLQAILTASKRSSKLHGHQLISAERDLGRDPLGFSCRPFTRKQTCDSIL